MLRVPASVAGLAAGVAFGLVAMGGVASAQETVEPTPTVDADGDAVRAAPDANGDYAANGDGEDIVYGDIGPGTQIGEPIVVETAGGAPAAPATAPVTAPLDPTPVPAVASLPADTYTISMEDGEAASLGVPGRADAGPGTIEGVPFAPEEALDR